MKNRVVLVPFPFDDLTSQKVRPAVCLTNEIGPFGHLILAFITSNVSTELSDTDLVIDIADPDFAETGLKVTSAIRLHRLMTVSKRLVVCELGKVSLGHQKTIRERLIDLFGI